MNIYWLNLISIFGVQLMACLFRNKKKVFCVLTAVLLIGLVGLRDVASVGIDLGRYARHYEELGTYSLLDAFFYSDGSSGLYYALNCVFSGLDVPFQAFVFVLSFFVLMIVSRFFYKYSPNPLLSYLIYFGMGCFTFMFSGLRQAVSMAIVLLCFEAYNEKKYRKMLFSLTIAALFHSTAIVVLPLLIMGNKRFSNGVVLLYLVVLALSFLLRVQLGQMITGLFASEYIDRYDSAGSVGGMAIFCIAIGAFFFFMKWKDIKENAGIERSLAHGFVFMVILQLCASYAYAFTRVNLYYMQMIMTLTIPISLQKDAVDRKFEKLGPLARPAINAMVAVLMIYMYMKCIAGENLLNYKFFWEQSIGSGMLR